MIVLARNIKNCKSIIFMGLLIGIVAGPGMVSLLFHNLGSVFLARNYLLASDARDFEEGLEFERFSLGLGQVPRAEINYYRFLLLEGQGNGLLNSDMLLSLGDPFLMLEFGQELWKEGDREAALELWRMIPNSDVFFANQGFAHGFSREFMESLSDYHISWAISSDVSLPKSIPYLHFAELLWKNGDVSLSIEVCQKLIEDETSLVLANQMLGMIYYNDLQDFVSAEKYFREVQRTSPKTPRADLWLGLAIFRQGRLEDAIQVYKRGIELHPDDDWLNFELGRALLNVGEVDEAKHYLQRSVQLFTGDNRGLLYLDEARRLLEDMETDE